MRIAPLVMVGLGWLWCGAASAETLGTFSYTAPAGYKATRTDTRHDYQKVEGTQYCMLSLYAPRALGAQGLEAERAVEWKEIVASQYTVGTVTTDAAKTSKKGTTVLSTRADVSVPTQRFHATLLSLAGHGSIGSLMVLAPDEAGAAMCRAGVAAVVDSLTIKAAPAPSTASAPASTTASTGLAGTWSAGSSSRNPTTGLSNGSLLFQYQLLGDGTYRFRSQAWGGHHAGNNTYYLVEESGTYKATSDTLTLTPKEGGGVTRAADGRVLEKSKVKLETTTYAWRMHYFSGIQQNQLVLVPAGGKPTQRDGAFSTVANFPASYLYSAEYKPQFKFAP